MGFQEFILTSSDLLFSKSCLSPKRLMSLSKCLSKSFLLKRTFRGFENCSKGKNNINNKFLKTLNPCRFKICLILQMQRTLNCYWELSIFAYEAFQRVRVITWKSTRAQLHGSQPCPWAGTLLESSEAEPSREPSLFLGGIHGARWELNWKHQLFSLPYFWLVDQSPPRTVLL